jgi:hypothetical protein
MRSSFLSIALRLLGLAALGVLLAAPAANARATNDVDADADATAAIYRGLRLPPFFQRRIQSILEEQQQKAQENADKVGVRRMSRRRFRRELVVLDRQADAQIRALIGGKKFAAWKRARAAYARGTGPASWPRDRCADLARRLRGSALSSTTAELAHVWIHNHAQHC